MRRELELDLDLIFPINDEPSAWLMGLKADCLFRAGVISERQKQAVRAKAEDAHCRQAA